jgi:hypothetical protein
LLTTLTIRLPAMLFAATLGSTSVALIPLALLTTLALPATLVLLTLLLLILLLLTLVPLLRALVPLARILISLFSHCVSFSFRRTGNLANPVRLTLITKCVSVTLRFDTS